MHVRVLAQFHLGEVKTENLHARNQTGQTTVGNIARRMGAQRRANNFQIRNQLVRALIC